MRTCTIFLSLTSLLPHFPISWHDGLNNLFFKTCMCLIVRSPHRGNCAQTLVLGVMLSVLMEVELSLDSSVFLSSFSVLLHRLFPKDVMMDPTDRVRKQSEMDKEVNGFSLRLPLLPLNHHQPGVRLVLLLLDSDWGRKMGPWLIVMEWGQSNTGMAHGAAPSVASPYRSPCLNHEAHWVEQSNVAHAWQRGELFWIRVKFLFKFMPSRLRHSRLWNIKWEKADWERGITDFHLLFAKWRELETQSRQQLIFVL